MSLMTGEQYIESIRKLNMEIYMFGKRIDNPVDDPILRPSLNSVRMTYDLAQMPEYEDLMTAISPYTGRRVNRFTHILQCCVLHLLRGGQEVRHPLPREFQAVHDLLPGQ